MVSSSSCPPTYRPCEAAAAPPPPPAAPSTWGRYQQRAPGSTAQANLRKIIAIITAVFPPLPDPNALQSQLVPPPPRPLPPVSLEMGESKSRLLSASSEGHGMRIDLRLRLGPPSQVGRRISRDDEDHEAGLLSSACSAVGEGTTKLTEAGGGISGVAVLETAESGIVSASYDGAHGSVMLDSNSSEEKEESSEGEWDAQGQGGGRAEEEAVKEARAEKGEEERGGEKGGEEREARPCSEITTIWGNTNGRGTEESDATEGGSFVRTEEAAVVREEKKNKSRKMDGDNETDTGRRRRRRDEGYLGLLLEAVGQVSGGLFGDEDPRKQEHAEERREEGRKSSEGHCAAAAFDQYEVVVRENEALGPVVRSKRGRSQALPSRYRDSVLEPWRKYSGGGGGHNRQPQRR